MKGVKGVPKKKLVPVYFEKEEITEIKKKARKELSSVSPFLRKTIVKTLDLAVENS